MSKIILTNLSASVGIIRKRQVCTFLALQLQHVRRACVEEGKPITIEHDRFASCPLEAGVEDSIEFPVWNGDPRSLCTVSFASTCAIFIYVRGDF